MAQSTPFPENEGGEKESRMIVFAVKFEAGPHIPISTCTHDVGISWQHGMEIEHG